MEAKGFLFGTVGVVAILNGTVAVLAFLKDVLTATNFGTSLAADSLTLAYFLPDTIGNNLIASAIGVSCVPVFAKAFASGSKAHFVNLVRTTTIFFCLLALAVWLVLWLYNNEATALLAGSSTSTLGRLTASLIQILLSTIVIFPVFAVGSALLQTTGIFSVPAGAPLLSHLLIILVLIYSMVMHLDQVQMVYLVAWSLLLGAIAMTAFIWFVIWRKKPLRAMGDSRMIDHAAIEHISRDRQAQGQLWKIFVPYLLILASSQIGYFVERNLAAGMGSGIVAGLNYAFRLSQLPVWVFVAAIYSVVLPSMSQDVFLNQTVKLKSTIANAFKDILLVTLPTTLFLFFLRVPIISILFQRGAFNEHSVYITAEILKGYSLSIIGLSISAVCVRYFLAAGKMLLPLAVSIFASGVNIAADYLLKDTLGAASLGYGAAIGATVSAVLLTMLISKELQLSIQSAIRIFGKMLMANALPSLLLFLLFLSWNYFDGNNGKGIGIIILASGSLACLVIYYATLRKIKLIRNSGWKGR
ncbi:murein biosynthesis integral membrane protein MurJ [Paenibacillus aceris]|uniref:Peptidoglycan lipid II flippase n=1 Tax=Paenibacillus aceris TaxID=869555 RepID=A0ABS4HT45_9BACL|nr:lipid II flippase MurJ [Paenibacillus aceris]MBP1961788.1 putative peptidoglycan lipid II flippase [Paenibacillus aceris]NHW34355.1 hypothetical protein [Paenibacillus aceris]